MRIAEHEVGVSKHIPITHLNEKTVFETRAGHVGQVLQVQGVASDAQSAETLAQYKRVWHQALANLGEDFCVTVTLKRQRLNTELHGDFPDRFTRGVDKQYRHRQSPLYQNALYITILLRGVQSGKAGKVMEWLDRLSQKTVKTARSQFRRESVATLKKTVLQLKAALADFQPCLVSGADLLTFFADIINGGSGITLAEPVQDVAVERLGEQTLPACSIAHSLPQCRLSFGEYIELKGVTTSRFAAMVSVKHYGTETSPSMLDKLLHLDGECIVTNTFATEPKDIALKRVRQQLNRLESSNDAATSQQLDLMALSDDLASDRCRAGFHHHTVMLMADSLKQLKAKLQKLSKIYNDQGLVVVHETIGQEAAFWAQLPGNQKYIVRGTLITSLNFVDFSPLHNYATGYRDQNHLGAAVTLIETPAKTPLFFNFHAKGSGDENDLTPGHTTIIGGNGSGKTVLMGFMDAQMSRYGGRSFIFDRDRGMEIYVRACGGSYFRISPSQQAVGFNPFSLKDTARNRSFLKTWLCQLVLLPEETLAPPTIESAMQRCVDYAFDALDPEHRCLRNAVSILPIDFERAEVLTKWLGEYAYLFDHQADSLTLENAKVGFDFTELMNEPTQVLTAVSMYLMHRIKASLDGQRVSIYFDEGWQFLDNPYWNVQLKKDLPTLRKLNAHVVLATQSPESVIQSALSAQFLDNCATHIFFCNEKANYDKHYRHFGLTESEFQFIKNTNKAERLFLYQQGSESHIARLNLTGMAEALKVFSANAATLTEMDRLRKKGGDWLTTFTGGAHA